MQPCACAWIARIAILSSSSMLTGLDSCEMSLEVACTEATQHLHKRVRWSEAHVKVPEYVWTSKRLSTRTTGKQQAMCAGTSSRVVLESLIEGTLLTFETLNIGIGATAPNKFRRSRVCARVPFAIYFSSIIMVQTELKTAVKTVKTSRRILKCAEK